MKTISDSANFSIIYKWITVIFNKETFESKEKSEKIYADCMIFWKLVYTFCTKRQ